MQSNNPHIAELQKVSDYFLAQWTRKGRFEFDVIDIRKILNEVIAKYKTFEEKIEA